jgi:hypothetical protein
MDPKLETTIAELAKPTCPHGGAECGPFERVTAADVRPGEIYVTVRCLGCQACAHYVLPANPAEVSGNA